MWMFTLEVSRGSETGSPRTLSPSDATTRDIFRTRKHSLRKVHTHKLSVIILLQASDGEMEHFLDKYAMRPLGHLKAKRMCSACVFFRIIIFYLDFRLSIKTFFCIFTGRIFCVYQSCFFRSYRDPFAINGIRGIIVVYVLI